MDAQPLAFPSAIGIDVAKGHCDVKFPDQSRTVAFQFDDAGFKSLLERLVRFPKALIVIESTGGYERREPLVVGAVRVEQYGLARRAATA